MPRLEICVAKVSIFLPMRSQRLRRIPIESVFQASQERTGGMYDSSSSGAALPAIDLSGISALQNIPPGTNVTFRIANYAASASGGTWYVYDVGPNAASLDFAVQGSVASVVSSNPPAAAPVLTNSAFAAGQFQFTVTGTAGSNYIVQCATNLTGSNWVSLRTNPAPFQFTETNVTQFPSRFYRGVVGP